MYLLRRAWDYLKPADATSNRVIAETETTEKDIDLVIEKREGLLSSAAAGINVTVDAAKLVGSKTNIKQRVGQIRGYRGKTPEEVAAAAAAAETFDTKNLNDIDEIVEKAWVANNTAAVANNSNATNSNQLSDILDTARGLVLHDLPIPISPEQARQAVLAQAAQAAFNQALHLTRSQDIAQSEAQAAAAAAQTAAQAAEEKARPDFERAAQEAATRAEAAAQAAPQAKAYITPDSLTTMGNISIKAIKDDEQQYQANNKLNEQKYKCLPDVVFEYNVADEEKLTALRAELLQRDMSTLQFRGSCVEDSALQLRNLLHLRQGLGVENEIISSLSRSFMERFTESWAPYLNRPSDQGDKSVDTNNRIFYNRVTSCLDALDTYSVFSSSQWAAYKRSTTSPFAPQIVSCNPGTSQLVFRDPVRAHVPPPPPPPPGPYTPAESYYDEVPIGPYNYVIGPILDFQNIEGRIFIYVKCYDDNTYKTGTYFWVYRSQSEGLYRVFFKIIPNKSIEKGYDYTQATLVHFKLQIALNKYYDRHAQRGGKNPIIINTLSRLNYFVGNMSYLQDVSFLDTFPNRANIIPSFYSIPGEANTVWMGGGAWNTAYMRRGMQPPYCDRARQPPAGQPPAGQQGRPGVLGESECCYVCLIPPTPPPPPLPPPPRCKDGNDRSLLYD
jgi:hypothetical protein